MRINLETTIQRDRHRVWQAFDNPENLKRLQRPLSLFVLPFVRRRGEARQIGARWQVIYQANGRENVITETVTKRNEPAEFTCTYDSPQVHHTIHNKFIALDDQTTKWVVEADFAFKGFWLKVLALFMRARTEKRTRAEVERCKTWVEEQSEL